MMIAIIGGGKKKPSFSEDRPEQEDGEESFEPPERGEARIEAARAAIRALRMGDAKALDEALEAHYEACGRYAEGSRDE